MGRERKVYLAADLGAGSGRVIAGLYDGERLRLEEFARFENEPRELHGRLYWKCYHLYDHICQGLQNACRHYGQRVVSVGVDTWGVDYGLFTDKGSLLGNPRCYRDSRTMGLPESFAEIMAPEAHYHHTGIQTLPFNTLYQLIAEKRDDPAYFNAASRLLFMPDVINYWLCGESVNERTNASTSQLYDPTTHEWATDVIDAAGLPRELFGTFVDPATPMGQTRLKDCKINLVSVCSHDTASAVAAAPLVDPSRSAYLSSGTWSLMGAELPSPIKTAEAQQYNFTNEVGYDRTIRFLKNLSGLWIMQELRKELSDAGAAATFANLCEEAAKAPAFTAYIDADDPVFTAPGPMTARVHEFCQRRQQPIPATAGSLCRVLLESLTLKYARVFAKLQKITAKSFDTLHIIGGGCQNTLLNQLTANALQTPVQAGPVEATAAGNIMAQMRADGVISSWAEGREVIRRSFAFTTYEPQESALWEEQQQRYNTMFAESAITA